MTKVLVIEDDAAIAAALQARLQACGFEAETAADPATGMIAARRSCPDLLIVDITMPAGGGFAVAERVRAVDDLRGTPLIFITASRRPELRERASEFSAYAFVEKPFDSHELVDVVKGALAGPPLSPAPERGS